MALPNSPDPISINQIATEFGGTAPHGINEYYRSGGLVPNSTTNSNIPTSGAISLGNFYGGVNRITGSAGSVSLSSNILNYVFNPTKLTTYVAGATDAILTIDSGVYVYSDDVTLAALTISGWTTGDTITIINNGYIIGRGGNGAGGINLAGQDAGTAISLSFSVKKFTNSGYIAGGGGGGGAGGGGGGAGGGNGHGPTYAGLGGAPGQVGGNGGGGGTGGTAGFQSAGAGGGRIIPGTGGAGANVNDYSYGGGAGGGGGSMYQAVYMDRVWQSRSGGGGGGGGWGASGGVGGYVSLGYTNAAPRGYGGAGGAGGNIGTNWTASSYTPVYGGTGGRAITLNGFTVTFDPAAINWEQRIYGNYT